MVFAAGVSGSVGVGSEKIGENALDDGLAGGHEKGFIALILDF